MRSLWFSICLMVGFALPALAAPPNIVFFIADDMTPDMFNCLPEGRGKNLTPNIDRLAAEGVVLKNQYVVSPVCTPSRYNCLTGRFGSRATNGYFKKCMEKNEGQKVVDFNTHLQPQNTIFPRLLQQGGYKTGFTGKDHVVELSGTTHFTDYDARARNLEIAAELRKNQEIEVRAIKAMGFDYAAHVYADNPASIGLGELASHNMDWVTQGGLNFVDQYRDEPFFLYFATTVPHGPMEPDHSWNADPLVTAEGFLDEPLHVQPPRHTIPERLRAAGLPVNVKTANMLWLDDGLGALMDRLEKNGELDNTIIFFFNDHGQNAKGTLYEGGIHDPSMVWKKGGFPCGSKLDALISNVDFAPTILDMAGVKYDPNQFDGQSFYPYLNGAKQKHFRELYHELGYARAIRKGNWKYIAVRYPDKYENMPLDERARILKEWNDWRRRSHMGVVTEDPTRPFSHLTAIPGGAGAESYSTGKNPNYYDRDQLYNLANDPNEQVNLANNPEYAEQLAALKKILQKKIDELDGNFDLSKTASPSPVILDLMEPACSLSNMVSKGCTTQIIEHENQEKLKMVFHETASAKWVSVGLAKDFDFSGYSGVEARLVNIGSCASEILLRVDNPERFGEEVWNTTVSPKAIAPGETIILRVEFGYDHYKSGRKSGYALDTAKVSQILFGMERPDQEQAFRLDALRAFK